VSLSLGSREAEVMNALWQHGPLTVNDVLANLTDQLAYTTVLTILRNLESKGCVRHSADGRAHRYEAIVKQSSIRRSAVRQLADTLFRGSSSDLLLAQLSSERKLSEDQVRRIQAILDENEKPKRKP
jgi:BlaI family transcriptional regulator, penicillinase repressor